MKRSRLTPLEVAFVLVLAQLGPAFFLTPRYIFQAAGPTAPFAMGAAAALALLGVLWTLRSVRPGPPKPHSSFGRASASAAGALLLAFNLATMALTLRIFVELIQTLLYPSAPLWALAGLFILAAYIAEAGTAANVARTAQVVLTFSLPAYFVANAVLVPRLAYPLDLIPRAFAPTPVLLGAMRGFLLFWGYDVLHAVSSDLKSRKEGLKPALPAFFGNLVLMVLPSALVVGLFGIPLTLVLRWPIAEAFRVLAFPGFLLNRVGVLVVASWTIVVEGALFLRFWVFGRTYALMFRSPAPRWAHMAVPAVVGFLAAFAMPPAVIDRALDSVLVPLALATAFLVPLLTGLASGRRRTPKPA